MAENKTRPTGASVEAYIAAIADEERRRDCEFLLELMSGLTRQPPRIWGTGLVGFGTYHYKYETGREGDMFITGFASRSRDISVYLLGGATGQEKLLAKLGNHKMGKACLNIRRLADVDTEVLRQLVSDSVARVKRRYG